LEDHQNRISPREGFDLRPESLQRPLSPLLWRQLQRRIAPVVRQRQHFGVESGVLLRGRSLRKDPVYLVELGLQAVVICKPGHTFKLTDDRIKRAVGVVRRTEIAQARVRLSADMFQERRGQSRLAYPRLARQQYHLTCAGFCPRPAAQQQADLFLASNQIRQASRMHRLETAGHGTGLQYRPSAYPLRHPFDMLRAQILELEDIAQETPRVVGDHHLIWLSAALQTRSEVRRLPDDAAFPQTARIRHLADDHQAGGNPDPCLQWSVRPQA